MDEEVTFTIESWPQPDEDMTERCEIRTVAFGVTPFLMVEPKLTDEGGVGFHTSLSEITPAEALGILEFLVDAFRELKVQNPEQFEEGSDG